MERIRTWTREHMTPWRWTLLLALVLQGLWLVWPPPADWVERWYSQGLYPVLSVPFVALQDAMPLPITAVVMVVGLAWFTVAGCRQGRQLRVEGTSCWRMLPWFLGVGVQAGIVLTFWMLVVWGAGYQRTPVAARWDLDGTPLTQEESERLQGEMLAIIQATIAGADRTAQATAVGAIAKSMEQLLRSRGDRGVRVPRQVRATPPGLFLAFSSGGMCVPAAIEPFADGAYDTVSFVQVAAHELAHVAGYNRESEATLIGYLAGLASENDLARYAVALDIYYQLIVHLTDRAAYGTAWEALPQRARDDIRQRGEIARRYAIAIPMVQRARHKAYDTFLKSQGIEEGMGNYSVGIQLFAGAWRQGLASASSERSPSTAEEEQAHD